MLNSFSHDGFQTQNRVCGSFLLIKSCICLILSSISGTYDFGESNEYWSLPILLIIWFFLRAFSLVRKVTGLGISPGRDRNSFRRPLERTDPFGNAAFSFSAVASAFQEGFLMLITFNSKQVAINPLIAVCSYYNI